MSLDNIYSCLCKMLHMSYLVLVRFRARPSMHFKRFFFFNKALNETLVFIWVVELCVVEILEVDL